jgi:hypothetical protein
MIIWMGTIEPRSGNLNDINDLHEGLTTPMVVLYSLSIDYESIK